MKGGDKLPVTLSPLRYPGGKSRLYKFVRNVIKENQINAPIYVEPFAGGAGLALQLLLKNDVELIIINDFDRAIYSFWYCVLFDTERLIELIINTPITIEEWEKQRKIYNNQKNYNTLELGFSTFFLNRTNRSGILKGGPISRGDDDKNPLDCRFNKNDLIQKIRRISFFKSRIHLFNYDAVDLLKKVIPKYPSGQLFIFCDPPYYKQGKNLYTNFYSHDDHIELSKVIKELSSHWITTYDFNQNIADIYKDVPRKIYQIQYSANRKRKEKEYLFHNTKTIVNSFDKVQFLDEITN